MSENKKNKTVSVATQDLDMSVPVNALEKMLANPDELKSYPVETLKAIYELHKEERDYQARMAYNHAFAVVQSEIGSVAKRGYNPDKKYHYARLEEVVEALAPLLEANGFTRSFSSEHCPHPDMIRFVLTITHKAGHELRHILDAPPDYTGMHGKPNKTPVQGVASSATYIERNLLLKVFGIQTAEDTDGNAAVGPSSETISKDQQLELKALLSEIGEGDESFLKYTGVKKIEDIKVGEFRLAKRGLDQRLERKRRDA